MYLPVRNTILFILLLCCLDLIKGKARIPSVYDCQKKNTVLNCTNHGFLNVPFDYFKHYGAYKIHLSENPYICDCSMVWFLREPAQQKQAIKDLDEMRCTHPKKLYRKKITELKEEEICSAKRISYKKLSCVPPVGRRGNWNCNNLGLDYIPYDIFERKQRFSLIGEYNCDCNMVWFIRRLKYLWNRILLPNYQGIHCKAPKHLLGVQLYTLIESDVCHQKEPNPCLVRPSPCPKTSKCKVSGRVSYDCVDINECSTKKHDCDKNAKCINTKPGYKCKCRRGFIEYDNGRKCKEIDQCKAKKRCPKNARCIAVPGSYRCVCKTGFTKRDKKCQDINECATKKHDCDKKAKCINTKPGYKCKCRRGFMEYNNGRKCKEIDQCKAKKRCPKNARCIAVPGSYRCVCKTGFTKRDKKCEDINECATKKHDCDKNAKCINTKPGYKCKCRRGFVEYNNGRKCKKVDQCRRCSKNARCIAVSGSYRCVCKTGFTKKDNKCRDINECLGKHTCADKATCRNTRGSYKCSCNRGYRGDGKTCKDIDECTKRKHCSSQSVCENTPGSYLCKCKKGFAGNGTSCTDINECATKKHDCDKNAKCINTKPGYKCKCRRGFMEYDNGRKCREIDQCKAKKRCQKNARCIAVPGSYRCVCKTGFTKRDKKCEDINECSTKKHDCDKNAKCINTKPGYKCKCRRGFMEYDNGRKCKEIDQCKAKKRCPKNARCIAVPGSYRCVCKTGFTKRDKKCEDINECLGKHTCADKATCRNTRGAYKCSCNRGYRGDGKTCKDINECLKTNACPAEAKKCVNTPGSYFCECQDGYKWHKKYCHDVNECKTKACNKNEICINHDGSYECRCKAGFQRNDEKLCVEYNHLKHDNVDESNESNVEQKSNLVVGIAVPICVVLVLSLATCVICFVKRMKFKGKKTKKEIDYF